MLLACPSEMSEGFSSTPYPQPCKQRIRGGGIGVREQTNSFPSILPTLSCQWAWFPRLFLPYLLRRKQQQEGCIFSWLADPTQTFRPVFTFTGHSIKTRLQTPLDDERLLKRGSTKALQRSRLLDSSVYSGQQLASCFANRGFEGPILKIPKNPISDHILTPSRPKWTRISEIFGLGFHEIREMFKNKRSM